MAKQSNAVVPWQAPAVTLIPPSESEPVTIVQKYAISLREVDKRAVASALKAGEYLMGSGHLWRKTMSKLRKRLSELGMRFLGEMLNREDITDSSSPEAVLTDNDTIYLAEALGYVGATGAMRLRHSFEVISHFDDDQSTDEMTFIDAAAVVRGCVQYVFASDESSTAIDFSRFRERLLTQTIPSDDVSVEQLLSSPPFFIRTALRALLAAAKMEESARLEHALANLNTFLPGIWAKLGDEDRFSVGTTFAELSNAGNRPAAIGGIRKALLKVKGFDFVPENLRSNSFKRAAQAVLTAHFAFNNFYNETEPTRQLASMGSSIPVPALPECLRAYLCVYLGNSYGHSWEGSGIAEKELKSVSRERWERYFSRVMSTEEDILRKLTSGSIAKRWVKLIDSFKHEDYEGPSGPIKRLLEASRKRSIPEVQRYATVALEQFKGLSS